MATASDEVLRQIGAMQGAASAQQMMQTIATANLAERVKTIQQDATILDAHGHTLDVAFRTGKRLHHPLDSQTDVPLMRAGGLTAQIFGMIRIDVETAGSGPGASNRPTQFILQMIDFLYRELEGDAGQHIRLALTADDIEAAKRQGKIAAILGMEGGDPLKGDLCLLRTFYRLGLRHLLLVHEGRNQLGTANSWNMGGSRWREYDPGLDGPGGLTPVGKEVVREMNRLGMLVDVSHLEDAGFWDVMETTARPVIASHSNARALLEGTCVRDLSDEQIEAIAKTGGVVGATAMWLCSNEGPTSLESWLDNIDHMVALVGPDHVGFGTDFSSRDSNYAPTGFEDLSKLPAFIEGLLKRGYGDDDVKKILGGNFVRVFREVVG